MKIKEGGVMDIQKEREAFESYLKKMGKTDNETFSKNEDDSYQMDIIHFGWKIWQAAKAQAVPDDYKVVPANYECVWCGCTELDGWTNEAMIESQEPK